MSGTDFSIRETSGDGRSLLFAGRAGPYRPVEFDGEQRFEVTWNPGSPVGVVQVLGAKEGSTTIQGSWKLRYLDDPDTYVRMSLSAKERSGAVSWTSGERLLNPAFVVEVVDGIRRAGQLLRVQWSHIVRYGMLKRFKHRWEREEDVYWEMEFEWVSQDDVPSPAAPSGGIDATQVLTDLARTAEALRGSLDAVRKSLSEWRGTDDAQETRETLLQGVQKSPWMDDLTGNVNVAVETGTGGANVSFLSPVADKLAAVERFADMIGEWDAAIQGGMNEWSDTINARVDGILSPVQAARRLVDTCGSIVSAAQQIIDRNEKVIVESLFRVSDSVLLAFGDVLAVHSSTRPAAAKALAIRNQAADAKNRFLRQIEPQVRAVHTAREGENLRDVSLTYYGTQDHWIDLMDYNGLEESVLAAGQVVFIPRQFGGGRA